DLTEQMAAEAGLVVDRKGYDQEMENVQGGPPVQGKKPALTAVRGNLPKTDDSLKYHDLKAAGRVLGWVKDNVVLDSGVLSEGDPAALLLDRTNFYAEQGGQVGDVGLVLTPTGRFKVEATHKGGEAVLHQGSVIEGHIECEQQALL